MALDTVFIATSGSGGSDANDGTIGSPKLTPMGAKAVANPSATMYFRGGTHQGGHTKTWQNDANANALDVNGVEGDPCIWTNFEDETVIITDNGGGSSLPTFCIEGGTSYVTVKGSALGKFIIDGTGGAGDLFRCGPSSDHIGLENVLLRYGGQGYQLGNSTDCHILNCTFEDMLRAGGRSGNGLYLTNNTLVDGCRFLRCEGYALQIHLPSGPSFSGAIVRNSIFDSCGKFISSGVSTERAVMLLWNSGAINHFIYNNLIKNCGWGIQCGGSTKGHHFLFNIIYNSSGFNFSADSSVSGLEVFGNIFLVSGGANYANSATGSTASNNLTTGNPADLFVNPSTAYGLGDFRPKAGSAAIGAGLTHASVPTDLLGRTRNNPTTIGCYEFIERGAVFGNRRRSVIIVPAMAGIRS